MSDQSFFGFLGLPDNTSDVNVMSFVARMALKQHRTHVPVKIIAVHGGDVDSMPTVDVQIMVNQIDGQGNKTDHGVIYGIPVMRNQGGGSAVINDPAVGDVGAMHIMDRDISALKANNGDQSNPGSFRTGDLSDGVYYARMFSKDSPVQYINFNGGKVVIVDQGGSTIIMDGGSVYVNPGGGMVYLGSADGSGCEFVVTLGGPSINVKAKV